MSRFLRFFGIFSIACACMFTAHSVHADTVTLTLHCGNSANTTKTVQRSLIVFDDCDDTKNGYGSRNCNGHTLPTRSESGCPAISGKGIVGWRSGDSLWMFKPGDSVAYDDKYNVAVGPDYTAVWGKSYSGGGVTTTVPFELVTTNLTDKKFTITIAAKGSYTVYCDLDNATNPLSHKATGPSSQSNSEKEYVCSYNNNSPRRIGIVGTTKQKKRNVFNQHKPVIKFGGKTTSDTGKIVSVSGSLGAVFNSSWAHTFGTGGTEYVAPSYAELFEDATSLTGAIPKHLFAGSPTHAEPNKEILTNIIEAIVGAGLIVGGAIAMVYGGMEVDGGLPSYPNHVEYDWSRITQGGTVGVGGAALVYHGIEFFLDGVNNLLESVVRPRDLVVGWNDGSLPNDLYPLVFRPKYYRTFKNSGVTGGIPDYLFGNLLDVASATRISWNGAGSNCPTCAEGTFAETFWGCDGLTSIPDNLFGKLDVPLYYKPRNNAFRQTFNYCTGLSSIPDGLFQNATGYAPRMFEGTFKGCYNIVGPIPENLFGDVGSWTPSSQIQYSAGSGRTWWDNMFKQTFYDCRKLGGVWTSGSDVQRTHFVPPALFGKKSERWSNNPPSNFMTDIFDKATKMAISCPSGYTEYVTGFRDSWGNGTGSEKVISCEGGGSGGTVVTISLNPNGGTLPNNNISNVYQKYNVGWAISSNPASWGASQSISVGAPTRSGYLFLGYFPSQMDPITPTGKLNAGWLAVSPLKVKSNGGLTPMNPNLQNSTTWYATWVQDCANLTYEHGVCTTQIATNGSYQYILQCSTGYHSSNDGQSCVSDATIYTFTLNKNDGTGGTAGPLYENYNVGWALSQSASSWTPYPTISAPSRSGYRFVGYFSGAVDEEEYLLEESDVLDDAFINTAGAIVADPTYASDGNLYAVYARECDTSTATANHATCQLSVGSTSEGGPRQIYIEYDTGCDAGYSPRSGDGTYQPKCSPIEYNIWLEPNGATSNYNYVLQAIYDSRIKRPDDNGMGLNANPAAVPTREYNISYNKNATDATLATLTNTNTKGTYSLKGFYDSPTGTAQYIGPEGYITQLGLDTGKHYIEIPENGIRWYAQWNSGTVTLPVATRPGYNLQGWYTLSNGGSKRGNPGQTYTPTQNETLYAHWTPIVYTFSFNDNNTDDPNHVNGLAQYECTTVQLTYGTGWGVTCIPRSGGNSTPKSGAYSMLRLPTRAGYVFNGYTVTTSSGQTIQVVNSDGEFTENYNIIPAEPAPYVLNAQWEPIYTITLNPNGGSGGASTLYESLNVGFSVNANGPFEAGYVFANSSLPSRTGYSFAGYWTSATGGSQVVAYGNTGWQVQVSPIYDNNNVTWYAHWAPKDFQVTLNDNGGSGGQVGVANQYCTKAGVHYGSTWYNVCMPIEGGTSSDRGIATTLSLYTQPQRSGFVFAGYWTTQNAVQTGDGVQIVDADGDFLNTADATTHFTNNSGTIYANWVDESSLQYYDITLNANNGDGNARPQHIYEQKSLAWYHGESATYKITTNNVFNEVCENGGCQHVTVPNAPNSTVFDGYWTTQNTGGVKIIDTNGDILVNNNYFSQNTQLYARWISADTTVTLNPNGGTPCATTQVTATYGSPMPSGVCQPTRPGYDFLGYYSAINDGDLRAKKYYNTNMTSANNWDQVGATATIYARWDPKNYTVSYKCSASGSVAATDTATSGEIYSVKDFSGLGNNSVGCTLPSNKAFVGWTVSSTSPTVTYNAGDSFFWNYTENKTFTAQFVDLYTITFVHDDATNVPSPAKVYLVPNENWYSNSSINAVISEMRIVPERTGFTFNGYWTTASGNGIQIVDSDGFFQNSSAALSAYASSGNAYARWIAPNPDFIVTTTSISAGQTFTFAINAAGNFVVDWGDGNYTPITKNDTSHLVVSHTYNTAASSYQIGISGLATGYPTGSDYSAQAAAISFGYATSNNTNVATPGLVGGITGSLGAIFPTIGSGTGSGEIPHFSQTFQNCSNMTGSIPPNLFSGVRGVVTAMFRMTFYGCSGLTGSIPAGLFSDVMGAADAMFSDTFQGCSGLTGSIPAGLFSGISGNGVELFANTFKGCSGLTGSIPAGLFSGITGSANSMFNGTFAYCSGLSGVIPETLFSGVTGGASNMFKMTFYGCSSLNGPIPGNLFSGMTAAADWMFYLTFYGCSSLNGSIPGNLFSRVNGGAESMFRDTFRNCYSLTGTLPVNLFSGITSSADNMFMTTFYGCSGLSSYIPPALFEELEGQDATDFMTDIFANSGLLTQCPAGMIKYEPEPLADYWAPKVSCVEGPAYRIALDSNGGTVVSGTTTEMIYEKYNTGWSVNQNGPFYNTIPSSTLEVPIVLPTKTNYDFIGYFDDPRDGYGSKIIDETGKILVPSTQFSTYSDNPNNPDAILYAHWHQGVDWVFTATTTTIPANGTVKFVMSAAGKFYVDCGTNGTLSGTGVTGTLIDRTNNTTSSVYTCTYSSGGASHQIKFGRKANEGATGYDSMGGPVISFYSIDTHSNSCNIAGVSGSLGALFPTLDDSSNTGQPNFYQTFRGCTNLTGSIPSGLFNGISGTATQSMFGYTFAETGFSGTIPSSLFSGLTGAGIWMFVDTFRNSANLTSIGSGLFNNITNGTVAQHKGLFQGTFEGTGISSSGIPSGLFSNISVIGESMFSSTFANCSNLTSVSDTLFSHIQSPTKNLFYGTFKGSGLQSVPANLFSGITSTEEGLFTETFKDCTGLLSVPNALFNRITGAPKKNLFKSTFENTGLQTLPVGLFTGLSGAPALGMFKNTFAECENMSGQLSGTMFAGIAGAPARDMFNGTFLDCSSLTGTLPATLFNGISGARISGAFEDTFAGCSGLTSYVPPALFQGSKLTGSATNFMTGIFMGNSNMATVCPTGMAQYITGFEDYWGNDDEDENSKVVSCAQVYEITLDDTPGSGGDGTIYWMPGVGYSLTSSGTYSWISVTPPERSGYWFDGYYTEVNGQGAQVFDDAGVDNAYPTIPTSGNTLTLYANWVPKIITVTLNDMGATTPASHQTLYLRYGTGFYATAALAAAGGTTLSTITPPQKTGYDFGGYVRNSDGTGTTIITYRGIIPNASNMFTADDTATIYAKWTPKVFNITYHYNGGYEVQAPYTPVEYISANGSSYFDTGINISRSNEIRARFSHTSMSGALYGSAITGSDRVNASFATNYGAAYWYWGTSGYAGFAVPDGVHKSVANYTGFKLDSTSYPLTFGADFTTAQTLVVGANREDSGAISSSRLYGRIYSFEIDNGTDVLFDGVPVCSSVAGTCGLLNVADPDNLEYFPSANAAFGSGEVSLPKTYASNVVTNITGVPTRAHSDFVGWCTDSGLENCAESYSLPIGTEGAKEYWAKWTCRTGYTENNEHTACVADVYTITFDTNEGTADEGQFPNKTVNYWNALPAINTTKPTRTGYTFKGWYDNATWASGTQYYTVAGVASRPVWDKTQSATLYAGWEPTVFTITLNQGTTAMGVTGGHSKVYEKYNTGWSLTNFGSTITNLTERPVRSGYTLRGYYRSSRPSDVSSSGNTSSSNLRIPGDDLALPANTAFTANTTLYAGWAKNCPDLGNTGSCTLTLGHDGSVSYVTSCATGYTESNHNTANVTCTLGQYNLIYTCGDGDGMAPNAVGIEYGGDFIFEDNISCNKTGHSFAGWRIAIEDPQPANPYQPGSEISSWNYTQGSDIVAQYTPNTYNISYTCGTGATGTVQGQSVVFGNSIALRATTACSKPGYVADGWDDVSDSEIHYASGATINPWNYDTDKTFTVKWVANVYTIDLVHPDADIRVGLPNPVYLKYADNWYPTAASNTSISELTQTPQRTGHEFTGYYRNIFNKNTMVTRVNAYVNVTSSSATWTTSSNSFSIRIPCAENKTYLIDFGSDDTSVTGSIRGIGYVTSESLPTSGNPITLYNGVKTSTAATAQRYYTLETGAGAKYIIIQVGSSTPGTNTAFWNNFNIIETSATPIINSDGEFASGSTTFTTENTTLVAGWTPTVYNITYNVNIGGIPNGEGYIPVEYIESANGSSIATGISGYGTWQIDAQANTVSSENSSLLVAYNSSAARGWFGVSKINGKWGWGGATSSFVEDGTERVNVTVEFSSNKATATIGNQTVTTATGSALTMNNYKLMKYSSYPLDGKLYSAKFYDANGDLAFNGIPVRRGNECGLYDTVSQTFLKDATHPFTCPAVTGLPDTYTYGVGATINGTLSRPHATFAGWCPVVNGMVSSTCSQTQTISTSDIGNKEYAAKWTCDAGYTNSNDVCVPNTITLSYVSSHGTAPRSSVCTYDSTFTMPVAMATVGYNFVGWQPANNITYAAGTTGVPCTSAVLGVTSGTANINAVWENGKYEITLDNNGATSIFDTKLYTIYNTGVYRDESRLLQMSDSENNIKVPLKTNTVRYDANGTLLAPAVVSPASQRVDARFEGFIGGKGEKFINNDGFLTKEGDIIGQSYAANLEIWRADWTYGTVELPLPTRQGYRFAGWYNDKIIYVGDAGDRHTVVGDEDLIADWTQCRDDAGPHSTAIYSGTNASNQCEYTVTCDTGYSQNGGFDTTTTFTATGDGTIGRSLPGCSVRTYHITYDYNGGDVIPLADYTPVEYVQTTGTVNAGSRIDLGFPATNNMRAESEFRRTSGSSALFGNYYDSNKGDNFGLWASSSYFHTYGATNNTVNSSVALDTNWHTLSLDLRRGILGVDNTTKSFTVKNGFTTAHNIPLFARYYGGTTNAYGLYFMGQLKSFTIYDGETRVFNGVPVKNASGVYGLYNTDAADPANAFMTVVSGTQALTGPTGDPILPTQYTYGVGATITGVPTRAHATFVNWCWTDGNGRQCATNPEISDTVTGDKEYSASWTCDTGYTDVNDVCTPNTYTLQYSTDHGTAPASQTCTYGSTVTLRDGISDAQGYTFLKWTTNNKNFNGGATILCDQATLGSTGGNVTLTATWSTNSYNCDAGYYLPAGATACAICTAGNWCPGGGFDYNANNNQGINACPTGYGDGGTGLSAQNQCAMSVAADYYVATANDASATACATGFSNEAEIITYGGTSVCDANEITITFTNGGHGGTAPTEPASCTYGQPVQMPAALSEDGYTFGKWAVSGTANEFDGGETFTCNVANLGVSSGSVTINATWTAISYNINYEFNGGYDPRNISGYTPVDYIASDGENYIDLGDQAAIQRDWAEITFKRLENENKALFGNYIDAATGYNFVLYSGKTSGTGTNKPYTRSYNDGAAALATNLNSTDWYTLSLDGRNGILRNYNPSEYKAFSVVGDYTTAHDMPLFARRSNADGTIGTFSKIQLRGFTLYRSAGVYDANSASYPLKLRGIPMRRDSDSVCGLYDLVGNTFMESAVTANPLTCPNTVSYPTGYTHGTAVTVASAPTREHSRFLGWCTDSALSNCGDPITIPTTATGNITLYAKWECNVGFVASGNTCVANTYPVILDNAYATTNGTDRLYAVHQSGVYRDAEHTLLMFNSASGNPITKPIRQYTVTYDPAGGTVASATATANYTFKGYYSAASDGTQYINTYGRLTNSGILVMRRYDYNSATGVTFYAQWTPVSVTLPKPSRPGYVFDGWWNQAVNGTKIGDAGDTYTPDADITLYAHWTQCAHTHGANSAITNTATNADNQCVYTVTCDTGYSQSGGSDATTSFDYTADLGIVTGTLPGCSIRTFTASYSCGTDTTGNAPTDDTVTYGTKPTLPSTAGTCAKVGHTLVGWRADGESANWTNGTSTWTYLTDKTFAAVWSANDYTITYNFKGGTDPRIFVGYTPVEYIESTGGSSAGANQYIATSYYGNPETRVFADYQLTALPGSYAGYLFGEWNQSGGLCLAAYARASGTNWAECSYDNSSSAGHWSTEAVDLNRHQFVISSPQHLEYWTDTTFPALAANKKATKTTTNPLLIFARSDSNTAAKRARMKLYGFQISEAGEAEFTGIPMRMGSKCGLLEISDTTAPVFYQSATSTAFSCPTVSALPANYTYGVGARIAAVPTRANARFLGWCPVVGGIESNECDLVETISTTDTGNKEFAAKWECDTGYTDVNNVCTPRTITLSYVYTPATTGPTNPVTSCTYDSTFTLPGAVSAAGHTFDGWSVGGNTFSSSQTIRCNAADLGADAIAAGAATITAQFTFDPKFTIVTTNMTANDTFTFYISARGTFGIDWGDGSPVEQVVKNNTNARQYTHTYTDAGVYNIRIGGIATGYSTLDGIGNNNGVNPAIFFYNSDSSIGTPTKIASITGSMGAVFPTLGSANGQQPRFYRTFDGATNLTSVSSTLFSGVTGSATRMFEKAFRNCSKLESIPTGLFSGVSGSAQSMFSSTFEGCSKITEIPSGLFDGVTGAAVSLFEDTFYNCAKLVTIPTGLFANVSGGAASMFLYTFGDCPKLNNIPTGLFNGVTTAAENIFAGTFMNDVALTTIPNGLFANVSGGAAGAFWATFYGCTGLTGPIPANMFQGITVAAQNEFSATFSGATHLSGYVPPTLFAGLNGATATDLMAGVFEDTNLAEECPCGTNQVRTGYEDDWSNKVACQIGLKPDEHWYNGICVTDCAANVPGGNTTITNLKTSNGLEFPILSTKPTTIALNFGMANTAVCYAPLESGSGGAGSMDISYNNSVYHVGSVSSTAPANWDPMAELVAAGVAP